VTKFREGCGIEPLFSDIPIAVVDLKVPEFDKGRWDRQKEPK
jgi:hypothetical protein